MNKEIRTVDPERGIICVTVTDERWYARQVEDALRGRPPLSSFEKK